MEVGAGRGLGSPKSPVNGGSGLSPGAAAAVTVLRAAGTAACRNEETATGGGGASGGSEAVALASMAIVAANDEEVDAADAEVIGAAARAGAGVDTGKRGTKGVESGPKGGDVLVAAVGAVAGAEAPVPVVDLVVGAGGTSTIARGAPERATLGSEGRSGVSRAAAAEVPCDVSATPDAAEEEARLGGGRGGRSAAVMPSVLPCCCCCCKVANSGRTPCGRSGDPSGGSACAPPGAVLTGPRPRTAPGDPTRNAGAPAPRRRAGEPGEPTAPAAVVLVLSMEKDVESEGVERPAGAGGASSCSRRTWGGGGEETAAVRRAGGAVGVGVGGGGCVGEGVISCMVRSEPTPSTPISLLKGSDRACERNLC